MTNRILPILLFTAAALALAAPSSPAATPDTIGHDPGGAHRLKARLEKAIAEQLPRQATGEHGTPVKSANAHAAAAKPASGHAAHAAGAAAVPAAHAEAGENADVWADLVAGNRRFILGQPRSRPLVEQRTALARGQHPRVIVLTCADSRVPPELLFDQSLGDLFVVRVAGNVVDSVGLGSIEYAVEHLHAHTLVVLGHSGCGAVKAAAAGGDPGSPNLAALVAHIQPVLQRLSNCFTGEELVERAITANARRSASELFERSAILRHAQEAEGLRTVAALYDLETGWVKEIK